jgi:hypothetical protein
LQKGIENRIASLETDTATEIQRSKNKINSLGEKRRPSWISCSSVRSWNLYN